MSLEDRGPDTLNLREGKRIPWQITGTGRLKCQVANGYWSGEYAIIIEFESEEGKRRINTLAHASDVYVKEKPTPGRLVAGELRVVVIRQIGDCLLVRLPLETFNSGPNILVPKHLVLGEIYATPASR